MEDTPLNPDDDRPDAPDPIDYTRESHNRRRASDEELHRVVEQIRSDISWFKRIVYGCWFVLGIVMYYGVLPASNAIHNDIDKNELVLARHEDRLMNLEGSRQRRIDRSREDHRNCHMKDLP